MAPSELIVIVGFLEDLGFTLDKTAPALLILLLGYLLLHKPFSEKIGKVIEDIHQITRFLVEVKTVLTNNLRITLQESLPQYGKPGSPVVLREEFRHFITKTGLDKQVEDKSSQLVSWISKHNPKTGLDAQDAIVNLVVSGEVENYLDLTKYKSNLYKSGKTKSDANGILTLYLFEKVIPLLALKED